MFELVSSSHSNSVTGYVTEPVLTSQVWLTYEITEIWLILHIYFIRYGKQNKKDVNWCVGYRII